MIWAIPKNILATNARHTTNYNRNEVKFLTSIAISWINPEIVGNCVRKALWQAPPWRTSSLPRSSHFGKVGSKFSGGCEVAPVRASSRRFSFKKIDGRICLILNEISCHKKVYICACENVGGTWRVSPGRTLKSKRVTLPLARVRWTLHLQL